jgi:nitrous oxidase accessory protein NosD
MFTALGATAAGDIIHVPGDQPTIKAGIVAANDGDTVLVAPGTYHEYDIWVTGRTIHILSSGGAEATVIDGQHQGRIFNFTGWDVNDSTLEGFTITNGGSATTRFGGGIKCTDCGIVIRNNIISSNEAKYLDGYGGGIYISQASPIVQDNLIYDNFSRYGAGIYIYGSDSFPKIYRNDIIANRAGIWNQSVGHGGGIHVTDDADPQIDQNLISQNVASTEGGGVYIEEASPRLMRNTISENLAGHYGGAMRAEQSGFVMINNFIHANHANKMAGGFMVFHCSPPHCEGPIMVHDTFHGNTADEGGGAMRVQASELIIYNSIFWNDEGPLGKEFYVASSLTNMELHYCDLEGGPSGIFVESGSVLLGEGMIDADPLFVDGGAGDHHLTFGSPCMEAGTNSAPEMPGYDFEGDLRRAFGTADMGADEFHDHLYYKGHPTPGGDIQVKIIGLPGTSPVGIFLGSGVLDPPVSTMWGSFYLKAPWFAFVLWPVPANGVIVIPATLPGVPAAPYEIPMQALIGDTLSNLSTLRVKSW